MNQGDWGNISLSVNGRKVTTTLNEISHFSDSLPPEAARLLMNQLSLIPENKPVTPPIEDLKINIKATMSPEAGNDPVKKEIEAFLKAKKEEAMVKAVPDYVQRALEQRDALNKIRNEKIKEFTIYESGVALGIVVGSST